MTTQIIDPHLHLFDLSRGDYHWLKSENPPNWPDKDIINKDFTVNDIKLTPPYSIAGFVHIEAGFDNLQPCREIQWLSDTVKTVPFKAVAFIDITADEVIFNQQLTQLLTYPCVVGCRYILDDNAFETLSLPQVLTNLNSIAKHKLTFELQMPLDDMVAVNGLIRVLTSIPALHVIINHAGFPVSRQKMDNEMTDGNKASDFKHIIAWNNWQQSITLLSRFTQCTIKCSGWEMADRNYSSLWMNDVISFCIKQFSYQRVMLSSNFPLCLFSHKSYQAYWQTIIESDVINQCTENEKSALLYGNALNIYQF